MGSRLDFQVVLSGLAPNVYFQPPSSIQMSYPCIIYQRALFDINHADNTPYSHKKGYTVSVIDKNPDSVIPDSVGMLESASFDRQYMSDGLYHDVFTVYY